MGLRPLGVQLSSNLICGDYLQVGVTRQPVYGHGVDFGFARIERVEHLPAERAEALFGRRITMGPQPVAVVWCHGLPGPVVLRGGDVRVLDVASPERVKHEVTCPWWGPADEVLVRGSSPAGDRPHGRRRTHDRTADQVVWPEPSEQDRVPQRPTRFTKLAAAVLVGDYIGVHPGRWPLSDREIDEGFDRVEHVRLLDRAAATTVFADPQWHTDVAVVSVYGLDGVLLLRGGDEISVLAAVNPERVAWELRNPWGSELVLRGSTERTEAETVEAAEIDAACRPQVEEDELYPSWYPNAFQRRMALEGIHGYRSVPLSALPWPHFQAACKLGQLATEYRERVPDDDVQAAHAAAAISRTGAKIRAACEYHQADWPRLVRILDEALAASEDGHPRVKLHPEFAELAPDEQRWLEALAVAPIDYDDGDHSLTNGQHRLCAMRFAGVTHCPVKGTYLPDAGYGKALPVRSDARAEIAASWRRWAADRGWPAWCAAVARVLPPSWRARLLRWADQPGDDVPSSFLMRNTRGQ